MKMPVGARAEVFPAGRRRSMFGFNIWRWAVIRSML
jgi:hypothetical protein